MFRPSIGSSSGLLWNQVNECCLNVGNPTVLTNSRNTTYLTCSLHTVNDVFDVFQCLKYIKNVFVCCSLGNDAVNFMSLSN